MKQLWLLPLLLFAWTAHSQNIILHGVVRDSATAEPVPFAHIYLYNSSLGTAANADGEFRFVLPERYRDKDVSVSSVGYRTFRRSIDDILKLEKLMVNLVPSTTLLESIVIQPQDAESIWRRAVLAHSDMFTTGKHRLQGFYRTTFQEDGYFSRLLEAAVQIHGGNKPYDRPKIEYLEIRKSEDLRKHVWKIYDGYLNHLVFHHPVRGGRDFLKKGKLKRYDFEIVDQLFQDDDLFYHLSATGPKRGMHDVEMLVRDRDAAIMKIIVKWHPENSDNYSWAWEKREDAKFFCDWQESVYEYQEYEGKMYPKLARWHRKGRVIDKLSEQTIFETESIDELLITNIEAGSFPITHKAPVEVLNIYEMAEYYPYQEDFWHNYNRPPDSEYFKNAKSKLENHLPLEEQYRLNSGNKFDKSDPVNNP